MPGASVKRPESSEAATREAAASAEAVARANGLTLEAAPAEAIAQVTGSALFRAPYLRNSIGIWVTSFMGLLLVYGLNTWLPTLMVEAG